MQKLYYIVKLGLTGISPSALLVKARNMVSKMTGNAAYPTPTPDLAKVSAACDVLEAAINAHDANPGPGEVVDRDLAFGTLKSFVVDLGGYVQSASNGDLALIKSAGCQVRKDSEPIGKLPAPLGVLARATAYTGSIEVSWGGVKGRQIYELEFTKVEDSMPTKWELLALTSKNRYTAEGLDSDAVYAFRVKAVGAAGASPVSDVTTAKAA